MTSSAAWQLAFGLLAVLATYFLVHGTRRTVAIGTLLVLIPFQFVDTKYASSTVLMAYALAALLLIEGDLRLRMLPSIGLIVLAYLLSLTQADRTLLSMNLIVLFQFFSGFCVFLLAYNFTRKVEEARAATDVLLIMNVLVLCYCALQLIAGPGEAFRPFGIAAFEFNSNRDPSDPRLVGPFATPGATAGYFTLMILASAVDLVFAENRRKLFVSALTGLNVIGLVATGNRTGFIILLAMFPVCLFVFRRELGSVRIAQFIFGGIAVGLIASAIAIAFTDFGRLFTRLEHVTDTEAGVPMTRADTWPVALEKIKREPWLGQGPYYMTSEDAKQLGVMHAEYDEEGGLDTAFDPYPHSLYLYLLRTVGVVGFIAVLGFFARAWFLLKSTVRRLDPASYESALVRLGLILIPAFLVAQVTLEFNRLSTIDYVQFIFGLVGLLVGTADRIPLKEPATATAHSANPAR